ncbi:MAG: CBASS cGAMP-activated phospholipase [Denitratisoma sp.]|nr:CBASS cGAMP-activated phospholipase [Denitratisoma sp.]
MQNETPSAEKDFWILALSGGGYRGLFTATVLQEMEKRCGVPLAKKFDLITGTSVGGMLAAALAKEVPADRLPKLFREHGKTIFHGGWKQWPLLKIFNLGFFSARYGTKGLNSVLSHNDLLGNTIFNALEHRLMIPAVNLSKGSAQFFKTQHCEEYRHDGAVLLKDAVMASAAAPTFFPVHRFNQNRYADGGLVANSPALVAFHEAVHKLGTPPDRVHVISIGTMNKSVTMDPRTPLNIGLLTGGGWRFWKGWRQRVFEVTLAAQEQLSEDMLRHILNSRVLRIDVPLEPDQTAVVSLDAVTDAANEVLEGQAREAAKKELTGPIYERWMSYTASPAQFFNRG